MKLSDYTLTILKNFSTINSGIVLLPGGKQRTIAVDGSIVAEAATDDITPVKFGIYDLNQFLGNVNTLNDPDLSFHDKKVEMEDSSTNLTYYAASLETIVSPPEDKAITLEHADSSFTLPEEVLNKVKKLADMNGLSNLTFVGSEGKIKLKAHERKNDTSNFVSSDLTDYEGEDFHSTFKTENFKMIPGNYTVEIKNGCFAKFSNQNHDLNYIIAMEIE